MNGKGDTPRPLSVSGETYAERWETTFGRAPVKIRKEYAITPEFAQDMIDAGLAGAIAKEAAR